MATPAFLGLRTVIYKVNDIAQARAWYRKVTGIDPYFDEPFYVGFDIGGFELGLDPDTSTDKPGPGGAVAYWKTTNADAAFAHLLAAGAKVHETVRDVGGGIRVATVLDPFGNIIGIIENPHDKVSGGGTG